MSGFLLLYSFRWVSVAVEAGGNELWLQCFVFRHSNGTVAFRIFERFTRSPYTLTLVSSCPSHRKIANQILIPIVFCCGSTNIHIRIELVQLSDQTMQLFRWLIESGDLRKSCVTVASSQSSLFYLDEMLKFVFLLKLAFIFSFTYLKN